MEVVGGHVKFSSTPSNPISFNGEFGSRKTSWKTGPVRGVGLGNGDGVGFAVGTAGGSPCPARMLKTVVDDASIATFCQLKLTAEEPVYEAVVIVVSEKAARVIDVFTPNHHPVTEVTAL
jgi:hypothetical protein